MQRGVGCSTRLYFDPGQQESSAEASLCRFELRVETKKESGSIPPPPSVLPSHRERLRFFSFSSLSTPLLIAAVFLIFSGCAGAPRRADYVVGYREVGRASWYGKDFHGRPTSSGEIYNMFGLSAAHQTLPLGTHLRVTELKSHRSVQVRVNDRGPFVGGRILDLSYGAAKALGIIEEGTAEVEIEVIGFAVPARGVGGFLVQLGSYQSKENALRIKEKAGQYYQTAFVETVETNTGRFHRVRVGPFRSEREAQEAARHLPQTLPTEGIQPVVIRGD
ncbi:MAG: septal ring lytic transglycosylase RlpA family protein [Nitrospirae bacterium]|nr:septal ring lytic transglycosylase RlpA family protein [Candidatus Manganitrophaceae bacterium]